MTPENYYNLQLGNFDLDSLDSFEYQEYHNLICYHNKVESLKIIIGSVKKEFNQLSLNLKDIALEFYNN